MVFLPMILKTSEAWLGADLDWASNAGYHRGFANMVFADGHVFHRSDASLVASTPDWQNIDPGPSVKPEYLFRRPDGKLKGFTY